MLRLIKKERYLDCFKWATNSNKVKSAKLRDSAGRPLKSALGNYLVLKQYPDGE